MKVIPSHRFCKRLGRAGYRAIVGIDEVGRGCWAGPVVAAAVILPPRSRLRGLRDSKLLSTVSRAVLDRAIRRQATAVGIGFVSSSELDEHGLTWAVRTSGQRALADLNHVFDAVMLDGNHNYLRDEDYYSEAVIKADLHEACVAAASIVAKVARDRYMAAHDLIYPDFGFAQHKGYGTRQHAAAIARGLTPLHRRRYLPIIKAMEISRVS